MHAAIRTQTEDQIAVVTIDRAHRQNAFDDELIQAFVEVFENLNSMDPAPRAVVLTGAGETSFSAGYDINCIDPGQSLSDPFPDDRFERVIRAVQGFGSPVIAAMNGNAFGGGLDLALSCDLRFARTGIKLAMTPAKLGLVYSRSGIERFVKKLGPGLTGRLFLTAEHIDAAEALSLGIVDAVVEKDKVLERALDAARKIAANAPLAVRGTRRTIQAVAAGAPEEDPIWAQIATLRNRAISSEDLKRALKAFAVKKRADFEGR